MVTIRIRPWRSRGARRPGPAAPPTDARRRDDDPRRLESDPELRRRHRFRRRVGRTVLLAIFVAGGVGAVFGERGWLDVQRMRQRTAELERAIAARTALVDAERAALERLRTDPSSRERIARERLGLLDPGEVDFLLPKAGSDGPDAP